MTANTSPITADAIWSHSEATPVITANFTPWLTAGIADTIASVTSVSEVTTSDLTITGEAVNSSTLTLADGTIIRPSHAIQFKVSGHQSGTTYSIKVKFTLTNNSNTEVGIVTLKGSDT